MSLDNATKQNPISEKWSFTGALFWSESSPRFWCDDCEQETILYGIIKENTTIEKRICLAHFAKYGLRARCYKSDVHSIPKEIEKMIEQELEEESK